MVREEFTLSDAFYVKLCNVCIKSFIALIHSLSNYEIQIYLRKLYNDTRIVHTKASNNRTISMLSKI